MSVEYECSDIECERDGIKGQLVSCRHTGVLRVRITSKRADERRREGGGLEGRDAGRGGERIADVVARERGRVDPLVIDGEWYTFREGARNLAPPVRPRGLLRRRGGRGGRDIYSGDGVATLIRTHREVRMAGTVRRRDGVRRGKRRRTLEVQVTCTGDRAGHLHIGTDDRRRSRAITNSRGCGDDRCAVWRV